MIIRQQMHEEQLSLELDALRQIQQGFQDLGMEMNKTNTELVMLLDSQRSASTSFLGGILIAERGLVGLLPRFRV